MPLHYYWGQQHSPPSTPRSRPVHIRSSCSLPDESAIDPSKAETAEAKRVARMGTIRDQTSTVPLCP